jgi:hypothetical protein
MTQELRDDSRLTHASDIRRFVIGGKALFTIRLADGKHHTYKVQSVKQDRHANWSTNNQNRTRYFVSALYGPDNSGDYFYIGMIFRESENRSNFASTVKSRAKPGSPVFDTFARLWTSIEVTGTIPSDMQFYHAGRCGFCGRLLTHPESLASGIGPECSGKG